MVSVHAASYSGNVKKDFADTDEVLIAEKLAQRLCELRHEMGLSQEEIAHRSGISTYTYQKFEKGESSPGRPMNPRLFTLVSLANTFEVPVQSLITFDPPLEGRSLDL